MVHVVGTDNFALISEFDSDIHLTIIGPSSNFTTVYKKSLGNDLGRQIVTKIRSRSQKDNSDQQKSYSAQFYIDKYSPLLQLSTGLAGAKISDKGSNDQKVLTTDEEAICVMIPEVVSHSTITMNYPAFNRFEAVRFILYITFSCITGIWFLYRKRGAIDSSYKIFFAVFFQNIGIYVRTSRKNRLILRILLQIYIFSGIVIKNFYECSLTSKVIKRNDMEHGMLPVDIEKIGQDSAAEVLFVNSSKIMSLNSLKNFAQAKIAVSDCDLLEHYVRSTKHNTHHLLPVKFHPRPKYLFIHNTTLSNKNLQDLMNLAHETGLVQQWNSLSLTKLFGINNWYQNKSATINGGRLITFEDLYPVFRFFFMLNISLTFVLLMEIFWHEFLSRMSWTLLSSRNIVRKRQNLLQRLGNRFLTRWRRRRTKFPIIQVRPVNC